MFNNFYKKDIRDIFFENIKKIFIKDKNIYILTNDADVFAFKQIRKNIRFIDVGVCEQNLINIASGLAKKGKRVIIFGFCNFLIHRAYEQIKINIGSMHLPVKIVGIGPGFSFPYDGPTHHAIQDIMNVYTIPEFEIINIADPNLANYISNKIFSFNSPLYIRIDKGRFEKFLYTNTEIKDGFNFINYSKKKNLIISSGYFTHLAKEVIKNKNIDLINFYKFKNFNKKKFFFKLKKYSKILIYDENTFEGGLAAIIANLACKFKIKKNIYFKVAPSKQIFYYSQDRNILLDKLKLGSKDLHKFLNKLNF